MSNNSGMHDVSGLYGLPQNRHLRHLAPNKLWSAIGLGLIGFAMCGLFFGAIMAGQEYTGENAREEINEILDTTIPEDAYNIHWKDSPLSEDQSYARFEAPIESVRAWLGRGVSCFIPNKNDDLGMIPATPELDWWLSNSTEILTSQSCPSAYQGDPIENLMWIEQTSTNQWIVYLSFIEN